MSELRLEGLEPSEASDLDVARDAVRSNGGGVREPVDIRALDVGYRRAALARDTDGHLLRLLER